METLTKADLIKPGEGGDSARPRFTEATIVSWLEFLGSFPESDKWASLTSISDAVRKHGVPTDRILNHILEGRLKRVFRAKEQNVFSSILIDKYEVYVLLKELNA
ncbi:hypothetical protein PSJ8397_00206 [Pseudooctadecabacter jejudonensis]|uniref:Uncharacterized protein n=2 Tax=Pseudooctadecabacter jejudonensis TaxID=1391910 RepID=A0A1Y5RAP6_9RHOB|nr:hypothetical protein PSJ8397_00206 [Pseudooctadecabacter jejudonensis]